MESKGNTPVCTPVKNRIKNTSDVDAATKRRLSDILVTLHKYIQDWQLYNQQSFETANTLSSLYNQWKSFNESNNNSDILEICKINMDSKLYFTREDLISQLKKHKEKLNRLYLKMSDLIQNIKAIFFLTLNEDKNSSSQIFNSWSCSEFYAKSRLLLNMYSKEYMVKIMLYNELLKYKLEDDEGGDGAALLNKNISVWLHQPYIDNNTCKLLLDSMLMEAELK